MSNHTAPVRQTSDEAPEARDAATVLPLRDRPEGLEVFMVRRHGDSGFMANRYVYPGGTLDAEDCTEAAAEHIEGRTVEQLGERLGGIEALRALGFYLAGVRETFEESGLLLARRRHQEDETFVDLVSDGATAASFERARGALNAGELTMGEFIDQRELVVPLDRLGYFAHWITPYAESRRYDTYFFVVDAPEQQAPLHDHLETTDSMWERPEAILEANSDGKLQLAPPTKRTLQRLAAFETVEAVMEFTRGFEPPTLLPHMELEDGGVTLYLPGDPAYPADDPAYARATPHEGWPTRMKMVEPGRWVDV